MVTVAQQRLPITHQFYRIQLIMINYIINLYIIDYVQIRQ